jgi:hypothetical protein
MRRLLAALTLCLALLCPVSLPAVGQQGTVAQSDPTNPNSLRHAHGQEVSSRWMPISCVEQDPDQPQGCEDKWVESC